MHFLILSYSSANNNYDILDSNYRIKTGIVKRDLIFFSGVKRIEKNEPERIGEYVDHMDL